MDLEPEYVLNDSYSHYSTSEPGPETVFVPVVWSLIIAVGVITNTLVVHVVIFQMKLSTVTNYYIVNLALTDITFLLFCVPFTTLSITLHGYLTEGICRIMVYVQQASVHATCMTLTIMSADRYFAIVYPIKSLKYRTRRLSFLLNLGVWILSFMMAVPAAVFVGVGKHWYYVGYKSYCYETFDTHTKQVVYYTYVFVTTYILPLVIICGCYSLLLYEVWTKQNPAASSSYRARRNLQQKKRTTRMLLVVVLLFFLFWLPTHVFNCWDRYVPGGAPYHNNTVYYMRIMAYSLAYSNSCVNPFVYAFMGNNFRTSFKKAFPCCFRRQIGARNSSRNFRMQRRGTEDGGTRVTVLAAREIMQMNTNNNMAPMHQATL